MGRNVKTTTTCIKALVLVIALAFSPRCVLAQETESEQKLCDNITVVHQSTLRFSSNERKLTCGIAKYEAWDRIPFNQAQLMLRAFLQERGFHNPSFEVSDAMLIVRPGILTKVTAITLESSATTLIKPQRKRKIIGRALTPKTMTEVETWAKSVLKNNGYPCPEVSASGFADSGVIELKVDTGQFARYSEVLEQPVAKLESRVLRRFDAFQPGQRYSLFRNTLSANRMEQDGIVQNAHLVTRCENGFAVEQTTVAGRPRLFMSGFGVNTEGLLLLKSSLNINRIDRLGSSFTVGFFGSLLKQEVETILSWYILRPPSRWYLRPSAKFIRQDEDQFEYISTQFQLGPAVKWDQGNWFLHLITAPRWSWVRTFEGASEANTRFLSGIVSLVAMTHDFEFFQTKPRSGYRFDFAANLNHGSIASDATAQRLSLRGEGLWNLGHFDPPWLVYGIRFSLNTTLTDRDAANFSILPPTFLHYLGGSQDLRGFSRGSIPRENDVDSGALTTASAGTELRIVEVLPWGLQPFVFADVGAAGERALDLDSTIYWNPGLGMRWQSFIGALRFTFAYGFVENAAAAIDEQLEGFQFYFSLGEEF